MRGAWLVAAALGLAACEEPVEEGPAPTHRGLDIDGTLVDLFIDRDAGTWRAASADGAERGEGSFSELDDGWLTGFLGFEGGDRLMYGVDLPDSTLVAELPGEGSESRLVYAAETNIDAERLEPLIPGLYTVLHVREDGTSTSADYAFVTIDADGGFFLQWRDSAYTVFDQFRFGENQPDAGTADVIATWSLGGDHPQDFIVHSDDGDWRGVAYPGKAIVMKARGVGGILVGLWSPLAHNQQSIYDNFHRMLSVSLNDDDTFGPPSPALIEVFGTEGLLTRFDAEGEIEVVELVTRSPAFFVGNVIYWGIGDEEQERLYQVQVDDLSAFTTGGSCLGGPPEDRGDVEEECPPDEARFRSYGLGAHFNF